MSLFGGLPNVKRAVEHDGAEERAAKSARRSDTKDVEEQQRGASPPPPPPPPSGAATGSSGDADAVGAALRRIASHIGHPKKFSKASQLLRELLGQVRRVLAWPAGSSSGLLAAATSQHPSVATPATHPLPAGLAAAGHRPRPAALLLPQGGDGGSSGGAGCRPPAGPRVLTPAHRRQQSVEGAPPPQLPPPLRMRCAVLLSSACVRVEAEGRGAARRHHVTCVREFLHTPHLVTLPPLQVFTSREAAQAEVYGCWAVMRTQLATTDDSFLFNKVLRCCGGGVPPASGCLGG